LPKFHATKNSLSIGMLTRIWWKVILMKVGPTLHLFNNHWWFKTTANSHLLSILPH